jgi:phosphoglycerate dehydrogenase-like enzyme
MSSSQILMHPKAYARISDAIAAENLPVDVVHWNLDGFFDTSGSPIESARPRAVWLSFEFFADGIWRELLDAVVSMESVEWLQTASAGYDSPAYQRVIQNGVRLANSNAQATAMSEYVLSNVLGIYQIQAQRYSARAASKWSRRPARELCGTKWLIVGFGSIGQLVAERAAAFGCEVVGVRRSPESHDSARVVGTEALFDELGDSDVVVISAPLTDETRDLVDAKFLGAMKQGSVLVNVGRGASVVDEALLAAIQQGTPGYAVLDVFREEPLGKDHAFWNEPNIHITAHVSAWGDRLSDRSTAEFEDNLKRFLAGKDLNKEVASPSTG